MILADTSAWIAHLRYGDAMLINFLREGQVLTHDLVIQELACGEIAHREETLRLLEALPRAPWAAYSEILELLARHRLYGMGLGAVDVNLLAAAKLARAGLSTRDKSLALAARRLGVFVPEPRQR